MMTATTRAVAPSTASGPLEVSAFIRKPAQWAKFLETVVRLIGRGAAAKGGELTPDTGDGQH
jgi:hypothetical protein